MNVAMEFRNSTVRKLDADKKIFEFLAVLVCPNT